MRRGCNDENTCSNILLRSWAVRRMLSKEYLQELFRNIRVILVHPFTTCSHLLRMVANLFNQVFDRPLANSTNLAQLFIRHISVTITIIFRMNVLRMISVTRILLLHVSFSMKAFIVWIVFQSSKFAVNQPIKCISFLPLFLAQSATHNSVPRWSARLLRKWIFLIQTVYLVQKSHIGSSKLLWQPNNSLSAFQSRPTSVMQKIGKLSLFFFSCSIKTISRSYVPEYWFKTTSKLLFTSGNRF